MARHGTGDREGLGEANRNLEGPHGKSQELIHERLKIKPQRERSGERRTRNAHNRGLVDHGGRAVVSGAMVHLMANDGAYFFQLLNRPVFRPLRRPRIKHNNIRARARLSHGGNNKIGVIGNNIGGKKSAAPRLHFYTNHQTIRLDVLACRHHGRPCRNQLATCGINATRGLRRTATLATFPPAIRAATSGVMISPAFANASPGFKREPIAEVPANCADGAASISTRCSSSETTTCSITIAVSNLSGIATPVLANSQSLPRTHPDVSGIPSTKSDQFTAIESIRHVNAFGSMHADTTSSSKTRSNDSSRRTISVLGEKLQAAKRPDTTSSHEIWICLERSLIFRPFMQTPQRETRCGVLFNGNETPFRLLANQQASCI